MCIRDRLWIASFVYCWQSVGFKINDYYLIKDYQLPAWGYSNGVINLTGNGRFDRKDEDGKWVDEYYNFWLSSYYMRYYESEKIKYTLGTSLSLNYDYNATDYQSDIAKNIERNFQLHPGFIGDCQYYVADKLFLNATISPNYIYHDRNESDNSDDYVSQTFQSDTFLGIGFGKIRDVSPVFRALRLRERVEALNKGLTLSENQVRSLADKFALYPQYVNIYDRYEKYFWGELAPILGSEFNNLSIPENLYLSEIMQESIKRFQGYELNLGLDIWQYYSIRDIDDYEYNNLYLGPSLRYKWYNNFNLKYQLKINSQVSYVKYIEGDYLEESKLLLNFSNTHYYDITDRIKLNSGFTVIYNYIWFDDYKGFSLTTNLSSNLDYFIENNFSLYHQLSFEVEHVDPEIYTNVPDYSYYADLKRDQTMRFSFGCKYYFGSMF